MTETIEAELVPTPEPEILPCDEWVGLRWTGRDWTCIAFSSSEEYCDKQIQSFPPSIVRKFHCTDQPRPAVTQERIEAAIRDYERRRGAPISEREKFFLREFARIILGETK